MPLKKPFEYLIKEIFPVPGRLLVLICIIMLILLPLFVTHIYVLRILIMINIFTIFAASWNLVTGYAGQLCLGHSFFFGLAAYASAIINTKLGWPPLATIPIGMLTAVLGGLIVGYPALRLKGLYLGLITLGMPIVLTGIVDIFSGFTGGEMGIVGIRLLVKNRTLLYYITLFIMILSIMGISGIVRSKVGLIFQAIRDDEIAARASGVNTTFYKLLAFCLSGLFAGIAGGLYAHFIRVVGTSVLSSTLSFEPLIWTIFGGAGTVFGPVLGVFVLVPVVEMLRAVLGENATVVYYVILVLVVIFASNGLWRWIMKRLEKSCPKCATRNAITRIQCRKCSAQLKEADLEA